MNNLDDVTNAADVRTPSQANFEKLDRAAFLESHYLFSSEAPVIAGYYVGGQFRCNYDTQLTRANVTIGEAIGADISFTLEVNGVLTAKVLTIPTGQTAAEIDLSDLAVVTAGQYARWKCTASPAAAATASQIHIVTNLTTSEA